MPTISEVIADYVLQTKLEDLPESVRHEGIRAFINWLGCVLGGCRHEVVDVTDRTLGDFSGKAESTVIGRNRQYDIFLASCLNCISSSVHTFDDTHAEAIVHPTGPVASAVFALAERNGSSGADVLLALCLGVDFECRLSKAITVAPARGSIAWSQTGICGAVGAAIATGKLLRLTREQLVWAIGIAASQAAGFRAMHGTMNLHVMHGRTAPSGLRAALLAKNNLTSSAYAIEGQYGFAAVFSKSPNLDVLTQALGQFFELSSNTYKPYPCGIVIHPIIDACLNLRLRIGNDLNVISHVHIEACNAALSLCARKKPQRPLDAQVSLYHWGAAALARGRAGLDECSPAALQDPEIISLQDRMNAVANEGLQIDQTELTVTLKDGRVFKERVEHCLGSLMYPMTDQQIEQKYRNQALTLLSPEQADKVVAMCWQLPILASLRDIAIAVAQFEARGGPGF
jgi:2-methylcitrate dehydratase PrpD